MNRRLSAGKRGGLNRSTQHFSSNPPCIKKKKLKSLDELQKGAGLGLDETLHHDFADRVPHVLVQPEMRRGRSPLVSVPPFGRGFPRPRYDHQAISQHGGVPAEASVSPGKIIVASQRPSGLRDSGTIAALSQIGAVAVYRPCFSRDFVEGFIS